MKLSDEEDIIHWYLKNLFRKMNYFLNVENAF